MPSRRLAALPMYDLPELRDATDALWSALAEALRARGIEGVPSRLDRDRSAETVWASPDLLFAQSCGYPLTHAFRDRLALVTTPVYKAPGCEGPYYRSWIVVPAEAGIERFAKLRGRRVAVNALDSQSGCNVLRAMAAPLAVKGRFFGEVVVTGGHLASLEAVTAGEADVAAIDAVTLALVERHRPSLAGRIRRLAVSPSAPALPFVARAEAPAGEVTLLRTALAEVVGDPRLDDVRRTLLLEDVHMLPLEAYAVIPAMRRRSLALGYRELEPPLTRP